MAVGIYIVGATIITPYATLYDTPAIRHHLPASVSNVSAITRRTRVSPTCPPPLVPLSLGIVARYLTRVSDVGVSGTFQTRVEILAISDTAPTPGYIRVTFDRF